MNELMEMLKDDPINFWFFVTFVLIAAISGSMLLFVAYGMAVL
jgi:hypothetical protein